MSPRETSRYGSPEGAEGLFNQALAIARDGGTPAAFRNAAMFYAVEGYPAHALSIVEEGCALVRKSLDDALLEGGDPTWPGSKQQMAQYFYELLVAFQRMNATISAYTPKIRVWGLAPPIAGPEVEERMAVLGLECYLELLWW